MANEVCTRMSENGAKLQTTEYMEQRVWITCDCAGNNTTITGPRLRNMVFVLSEGGPLQPTA